MNMVKYDGISIMIIKFILKSSNYYNYRHNVMEFTIIHIWGMMSDKLI